MSNQRFKNGLPVINAREPLHLLVEDCDIEGATPQDPGNCVAARAAMREHGFREVEVYRSRVYALQADEWVWYRWGTPPALRDEEIAFDRGGASFEGDARYITLPVLPKSGRATGRRQGSDSERRSGRMRRPRRVLENVRPHA